MPSIVDKIYQDIYYYLELYTFLHLCASVCRQGQSLNPLSVVVAELKGLGLSQATSPDVQAPVGRIPVRDRV